MFHQGRCVLFLAIAAAFLNHIYAVVDNGSVLHHGEATFYGDGGLGHCGFPPEEQPLFHGAMNHFDYENSVACGTWVHIIGPDGEVDAFIDDECPECKEGDIDVGPITFDQFAQRSMGRVPITWRYIPAPDTGAIGYYWKEGSSQWHIELQIRNHRYAVGNVEIRTSFSDWRTLSRKAYNFFMLPGGVDEQPGPYVVRVTDVFGRQLVDSGIVLSAGMVVPGMSNFSENTMEIAEHSTRSIPHYTHCSSKYFRFYTNSIMLDIPFSLNASLEVFTISGRRMGAFKSFSDFQKSCKYLETGIVLIRKIR